MRSPPKPVESNQSPAKHGQRSTPDAVGINPIETDWCRR
jgi:hypothetical protein